MKKRNSDPHALQQCNPEFGNMLRQIEMLKALSEQAPSEANLKRAMPYLYQLSQNLATVFYHLHGEDVATGMAFTRALISVLRRTSAADSAIIRASGNHIVIDGVFEMDEMMKFLVISPAPVDVDETA